MFHQIEQYAIGNVDKSIDWIVKYFLAIHIWSSLHLNKLKTSSKLITLKGMSGELVVKNSNIRKAVFNILFLSSALWAINEQIN
ncbi:MAG: hypothetical protein DHS20C18_43720 [Saprospiraceae bacterium]|nr:MAG: hypothetical protein DHS20C18_43720 [Saprospiraceae bacterium]